MEPHRYRLGQKVRFAKSSRGSGLGGRPDGAFDIVWLLPEYYGTNQYRIKSTSDGHERVVGEGEITLQ
jgi:hypothetical protein